MGPQGLTVIVANSISVPQIYRSLQFTDARQYQTSAVLRTLALLSTFVRPLNLVQTSSLNFILSPVVHNIYSISTVDTTTK
jgi:hypothetical protein